ncbi:hypothetical protein BMETH_278511841328, partial [methanotrophic bacterial endosymbiont of Bathymodiolus sp.]
MHIQETPPRAWGRQNQLKSSEQTQRNTPTGVGKTIYIIFFICHYQKHPHGRGEDPVEKASV